MLVFKLFFVVASVVSRLRHSRFSVPDLSLAFARVEASLCGPPALSPYLQFVCGAVDAIKPSVEPPVVFNFNTNVVYAGLLGASVFDPSPTGCLLNCTSANEPALVYFGPHQPPAGDCIVAPKFELLAPPPVRRPWERPEVKATLFDLLKSLLTLENLVYLGLLVFVLWRAICDSICDSTVLEQDPVYLIDEASFDHIITLRYDDPSIVALAMEQPEDELFDVPVVVVEPIVELVGNQEVAPVVEEPVIAVIQEVAQVVELPAVQDEEACSDVVENAPVDSDAALDNEELACPPSSPVIVPAEEQAPEADSLPVVDQPGDEVLPPQQPALPLEAAQDPAEATAPVVEDASAPAPVPSLTPPADVPSATDLEQAEPATAQPARRPTRCGKRLRTLRRQRALAEAEAAAAAAAQEQVEAQPPTAPQQELPPAIEEPQEPLTRQQRRAQRLDVLAARAAQSSSVIPEPPRAPTPVFTDDDFPPLPVEPVASKPLEHKMSYALVTAITCPSKTAAIRRGSWTVKINTVQPTPIQEPSVKWNAASRHYEDTPQDSRWTNWKMDLEDIATIKPAKTRKVQRSRSRVD